MARNALALVLLFLPFASSKNFLDKDRGISAASIHVAIQGTLDEMLGGGHGVENERLMKIQANLSPLFNVLPMNRFKRLDAPFMRYAVQRYFSQQHGWIVKGFEPHTAKLNVSETQTARIMHSKVPGYVEEVLVKKTLSKGGFALQDLVLVVASIERLIFDETLKGVESAFRLNRLSLNDKIKSKSLLTQVLISYFIVEHLDGNATDMAQHQMDKANIKQYYPHWPDTLNFIEDIAGEMAFNHQHSTNPFKPPTFAFEDVARITQVLSERFGPLSNHECHDMKMKLAEMDVHGTGRVKLSDFYRSSQGGAWQFLETSDYLSVIGALDTSSEFYGQMVIIPNYITGMNNCISSSLYYDICCLNECDGIYQHLESRIGAPTATAAKVLQAIEEGIMMSPLLSSTAPVEPRNLSSRLVDRLHAVAAYHNDSIPLHGRLFAQWLHYAFPQECPFPHMSGTVNPKTMTDLRKENAPLSVTDDEIRQHVESEVARNALAPGAGFGMWSMQEELLGPSAPPSSDWGRWLRAAVQVTMLAAFCALIFKEVTKMSHTFRGNSKKMDDAGDGSYYI